LLMLFIGSILFFLVIIQVFSKAELSDE
jgi:hypothetical protein